MAMPETGIGLFPDVGGSYFLSRSPVGLYLGLTGQMLKATDAIYANLADKFMTTDAITALVQKLDAQKWGANPADDIASLIDAAATTPTDASILAPLQTAINEHFAPQKSVAHAGASQKSVAEMVASLEAESRPEFQTWAAHTAAVLKARSPTLLEVTRRQLNRGSKMSLGECFRMELGIVYHCFEHGDLMEGIRAVILDKDNKPRWNPATLAALDPDVVAAFFAPRWNVDNHPLANLERLFG